MKPEVKNAEGKETPQNEDNNVNSQKEKQNLVTEGQALAQALKDYENPSKTLTPKKEHHPFSWWLKWASSIILIFAMIMTTHNLYPYNMFLQLLGVAGWLWVSVIWNDRALIVVNAVAVAIFLNGIFGYYLNNVT